MTVINAGAGINPVHHWALIKDDDCDPGTYWYAKWFPNNMVGLPETITEALTDAKDRHKKEQESAKWLS